MVYPTVGRQKIRASPMFELVGQALSLEDVRLRKSFDMVWDGSPGCARAG
jgi:hypothetical protein